MNVLARDERRAVLGLLVHHLAGELERGERRATVAAGEAHDLLLGVRLEREGAREAALGGEGVSEQLADRLVVERDELHDAAPADQGGVDLEVGVLGRRSHEHHRAVLDGVEQGVLLPAVEAVDLVDEQDRAAGGREQAALGGLDLPAQVLDRPRDGGDLDELGVRAVGDDARERGLARARGPVEDDRGERVVLDGAAQPAAGPHRLGLPDEAVERGGPHAGRERGVLVPARVLYVGEERLHGGDCTPERAGRGARAVAAPAARVRESGRFPRSLGLPSRNWRPSLPARRACPGNADLLARSS